MNSQSSPVSAFVATEENRHSDDKATGRGGHDESGSCTYDGDEGRETTASTGSAAEGSSATATRKVAKRRERKFPKLESGGESTWSRKRPPPGSALATACKAMETTRCQKRDVEDELEALRGQMQELERRMKDAESRKREIDEAHQRAVKDVQAMEEVDPNCQWGKMYNRLKAYRDEHGTVMVPNYDRHDAELNQLGRWVANQRVFYKMHLEGKTGHIKPHRIDALNKIGFVWNRNNAIWDAKYDALKSFKEKYGHLDVPKNKEHDKLHTWVIAQRTNYAHMVRNRPSSMTVERKKKLDELGFTWKRPKDPCEIVVGGKKIKPTTKGKAWDWEKYWRTRYQEMVEFKRTHGDLYISRFNGYGPLQEFCAWLRKEHKKYLAGEPTQLTAEKFRIVEDLGFEWQFKRAGKPRCLSDEGTTEEGEARTTAAAGTTEQEPAHHSSNSHPQQWRGRGRTDGCFPVADGGIETGMGVAELEPPRLDDL